MNTKETHLLMANYVGIEKQYLTDVILPAYEEVRKKSKETRKYYHIAGKTIAINFCNSGFAELFSPALEHCQIPECSSIDIIVNVFDSVSTSISFASPWSDPRHHKQQHTDTHETSELFLGVYLFGENTLTIFDKETKTAYFWISDYQSLPQWIFAAPLRTLLHWILEESNIHLAHGAVIGKNGNSILLSAKGGSGKSTTALTGLLAGMDYLADDYVGIELGNTIMAHSLYNSVKVSPKHIELFTSLEPHIRGREGEKSIIFLSKIFPERIQKSLPVTAIMIPIISYTEKTSIIPVKKSQALLALAPTTIFQLPLAQSNKMKNLSKIIDRVDCYFLHLGKDSTEAVSVLQTFLAKNAASIH